MESGESAVGREVRSAPRCFISQEYAPAAKISPAAAVTPALEQQLEKLFVSSLKGEKAPELASMPVYSQRDSRQTTLLILDRSGSQHKYVIASDPTGHEYIVGLPLVWVARHREILRRLEQVVGCEVQCHGGGFITARHAVVIHGFSCEYGAGDHKRVSDAFRAILPKNMPILS